LTASLTAKTTSYVHALIRDGAAFDYEKWLDTPEAKQQVLSGESSEPSSPISSSEKQRPIHAGAATRPTNSPPPARHESDRGKAVKRGRNSLGQRLRAISRSWDESQEMHGRDAVYSYLGPVFGLVTYCQSRKQVDRLVRRAQQYAGVTANRNADPFPAVIQATAGDAIDAKTRSKWSRALRYATQFKKRGSLRSFIKTKGGINACASAFAASRQ
jgi:hypothetical protein